MRREATPRRGEAQRLLLAATLLTCALLLTASRQLRAPEGSAARRAAYSRGTFGARRGDPAPLVAIADIHGDLENALLSLQLRHVLQRLTHAPRLSLTRALVQRRG